MKSKNRLLWVMALLLTLPFLPATARAQNRPPLPPVPPAPPMAWIEGIHVDEHRVHAVIDGPIAEVTVTQVFRNDSGRLAEGTFLFPLPPDAAVGDFQMTVNGQVLEGVIMDSDTARRIYEETVRQIRDPALLEYAGRGLFQTSVFPIPPGESRTLQLRYGVVLDAENGLHRFSYPLRVPGASRPAERTEVEVEIHSDDGLRAIYSPTHDVNIERSGDNQATVRFSAGRERLDSDFELYYGLGGDAIGLNLISHKPAGEDGYFVLLASPSVEVEAADIVERDVVFVLDVSGSMEGPKLAQAKEAVRYVVENLNPGDRFNLIAFSTGARLWSHRLVEASPATLKDAEVWIERLDASGSTDINRALLEALAQLGTGEGNGSTSYVLFMTDGLPTQGETEVEKIIRNAQANTPADASIRLFTFGVGCDVNTDLLDRLSRQLGGRSHYVRPDEAIDEAVSSFYATIQTPVLIGVEVDFGEQAVASDILPFPIPDLFAGEQLVVTGRYRNGGDVTVRLTGRVGDESVQYVYAERTLVPAGGDPFVARLWATRKIGLLMDEIRRSGPDRELVDAIVDLSMRYGIVTPYTSYLVEEPDAVAVRAVPATADAPLPRRGLFDGARASVAAEAEAAAEAPASGESAVMASQARMQIETAKTVVEHQDVRFAGGKAFVSQGSVTLPDGSVVQSWVDTAYRDGMQVETVPFAGDRYFGLAADPALAAVLALSTEVIYVVDDNHAIRITAMEAPDITAPDEPGAAVPSSGEGTPASEMPGASVPDTDDEPYWVQIWDWLSGNSGR